jgi:Tfp pilus assembly protein PilF
MNISKTPFNMHQIIHYFFKGLSFQRPIPTFLLLLLTVWAGQISQAQHHDYYTLGMIEMNQEKNFSKAEEYFKLALKKEPKHVMIINSLSICLMKQRKHMEADSFLVLATTYDSSYAPSFWNLGLCNIQLKRDSVAVAWFAAFVAHPQSNNMERMRGYWEIIKVYERMLYTTGISASQLEDLRHSIHTFIRLNPDAPEVRVLQQLSEMLDANHPDFNYDPLESRFFLKDK